MVEITESQIYQHQSDWTSIRQFQPPAIRTFADMTLFELLSTLSTEEINPRTVEIDLASTRAMVEMLAEEDRRVAEAVALVLDPIAAAVDAIVPVLANGGSLVYVGAGTSGRLGILDASEMPPTFGVDPTMVQGIIAGGHQAVFRSVEGAEDSRDEGGNAIDALITPDMPAAVCGLSASGRTPFVLGALERAAARGFPTAFVSTNSESVVRQQAPYVQTLICPHVGPEPIAGSTRMNSGTAQKMVINMISTACMVRLGKTYGNVMVDLQLTNEKLVERGRKIVMEIGGIPYQEATNILSQAGGHVKTALVMILASCSREQAEVRLAEAGGHVRKALEGTT